MLSANVLYVIYLVPFLFLGYPLSVNVEFVLTHLLVLAALYRMLSGYCRRPLALLLTCAWVPALSMVEGGATVAGIGFLALYLTPSKNAPRRRAEILPASLLAATLCHTGYLMFLVGNAAGALLERLVGEPSGTPAARNVPDAVRTAIKIGLAVLIVIAALHQSKRSDNNYMAIDTTYSPTAEKDALTIGFFQIGTWKEVTRKAPPAIDQDWYFTLDQVYGGARTIGQAFVKRPRVVLANLMSNVPDLLQTPLFFFTGYFPTVLLATVCIFALVGAIGFGGMLSHFIENKMIAYVLATSLGTASMLAALLLTWFNPRYSMALLPVGLLMVVHLERGAQRLEAAFRGLGEARARGVLVLLGATLFLGGLVMNEWTCSFLLRKVLSTNARFNIRSFDVLFLVGGLAIWAIAASLKRSQILEPASPAVPRYAEKIVLASALFVFAATEYPFGWAAQVKAVLANRATLSQQHWGLSTATAYPELLRGVTPNTRILSPDDTWLKAFANVDLDKITGIWGLPPFRDTSGRTEKMLRGQSQIWVSNAWSAERSLVSTQGYLRYRLHVEPLLKDLLAQGWTRREVEYYGTIYSAPHTGNLQ